MVPGVDKGKLSIGAKQLPIKEEERYTSRKIETINPKVLNDRSDKHIHRLKTDGRKKDVRMVTHTPE